MVKEIDLLFPNLRKAGYQVTSPRDGLYNCIAWAAGETQRWWWPDDPEISYWPDGVAPTETVAAFPAAFATLGYLVCDGEHPEPGFEKITLFAQTDGTPTHAARQLPSDRWSSKLGRLEDIEHDLHDLVGDVYGSVVQIMKRPVAPSS